MLIAALVKPLLVLQRASEHITSSQETAWHGFGHILSFHAQGEGSKTLPADLVIWATGAKPNTDWLKDTEFCAALDGKGYIAVSARTCAHVCVCVCVSVLDGGSCPLLFR